MTNKESVVHFFEMLFQQRVREAYECYIAADFIHHNFWFKGDRESLMLAMEEAHKSMPNSAIKVHHVFEDGDFVITHSHVKHSEEMQFSATHIFRFKNGKVVELWDTPCQIPADSPNKNGPF